LGGNNFMQKDFLQSDEWMEFQESVGRKTFHVSDENFWANIVEHKLPIVGKYFYIPRGPIFQNQNDNLKCKIFLNNLIKLARENNMGWIRIDAASEKILEIIKNFAGAGLAPVQIMKAPHDMQPREIFVIDISKSEEELLAEMKAKTRYNIKLSQKHNVSVKAISNFQFPISNEIKNQDDKNFKFHIDEFIKLVKITSQRNKITAHSDDYYRKMLETVSPEILKLYVAEYQGKVIAANLMIFYGNTCVYLHGASDDEYRNAMAPYLLQWQAIKDAKEVGCTKYDMGGVKISNFQFPISKKIQNSIRQPADKIQNFSNSWTGITKFKLGFSPETKPVEFMGSYDIILNRKKYFLYRFLQCVKNIF